MVKKYHHGWIDIPLPFQAHTQAAMHTPDARTLDCHEIHLVIDTFLLITCSSTIICCNWAGTAVDQQQGSGEDQPDPLPGRSRTQHPRAAGQRMYLPDLCHPYAR